jgi:prevent-host-death family protein
MVVSVRDARTHFSSLLGRVEKGQEFVIARYGKPVARLVPALHERRPPLFGADRGAFTVPDDFGSPLPDGVLDAFEGKRR